MLTHPLTYTHTHTQIHTLQLELALSCVVCSPSWREVDVCSRLPAERLEEVEVEEEEEGVEVEDLSDQVFSRLHQPCEDQERTRYRWAAVSSSTATNTSTVAKRRGSRYAPLSCLSVCLTVCLCPSV